VPSRVGAVVEAAVLHIDEPGEDQLGQDLLAVLALLHQTEEDAIGVDHLAAMDEGEPVLEPLAQRTLSLIDPSGQ